MLNNGVIRFITFNVTLRVKIRVRQLTLQAKVKETDSMTLSASNGGVPKLLVPLNCIVMWYWGKNCL